MGYIYMLTSPSGKSYIGQTYRPIEKRLEEHRSGKSSDCVAIYNAIQYHGWETFEKDWYEVPDEDLNKHEELMVEVLGTLYPDGYNLKEGGGNAKHNAESRQKMSNSHIGIPRSEETKQRISETAIGMPKSDEHRQNMRKTKSDRHKKNISESMNGEKNHMSKRVYQYDLEGNLLGSFGSSGEAGRNLKKAGTHIRACALGKNKTAYGFKWSYNKSDEQRSA
jgi:group I intron endonuclease